MFWRNWNRKNFCLAKYFFTATVYPKAVYSRNLPKEANRNKNGSLMISEFKHYFERINMKMKQETEAIKQIVVERRSKIL